MQTDNANCTINVLSKYENAHKISFCVGKINIKKRNHKAKCKEFEKNYLLLQNNFKLHVVLATKHCNFFLYAITL